MPFNFAGLETGSPALMKRRYFGAGDFDGDRADDGTTPLVAN
jgi:hypothetical protein